MLAVVEPVRWGLLSTARINAAVIPGLKDSPESELLAVASRTDQAAAAYADKWGIPRAHGSYEQLLADSEVEAVYISLPHGLHVDWSIRALEAGKHVLCEKPLARLPQDVERAFDAAERADRLLMEAFMWRQHPQSKRLRELVEGGAIGELRLVRASFSFPLGDPDDIPLDPTLDGGALMDVVLCQDSFPGTTGQVLSQALRPGQLAQLLPPFELVAGEQPVDAVPDHVVRPATHVP